MKLLIFDFDGPINDLIEAKRRTTNFLSKELGIKFSDLAIWGLINYIDQIYEKEKIVDYKKLVLKSLEKLQNNGSLVVSNEQKEKFSSRFQDILDKEQIIDLSVIKPIETIKNNNTNIRICIYTSQKEELVRNLLGKKVIVFDKIYGREYFEEPKPSLTNLINICKDFEVEPKEVVLIGDNVAVDLAPGSYLGMKTILINRFVNEKTHSLDELTQILK